MDNHKGWMTPKEAEKSFFDRLKQWHTTHDVQYEFNPNQAREDRGGGVSICLWESYSVFFFFV